MKKNKKNSFIKRLKRINEWDGNLKFGAKKFHATTSRIGKGKPADGYLIREQKDIVCDTKIERFQRINKFWEKVIFCPVCKSKQRKLFIKRMGVDIYNCNNCKHRYMNPRPKFNKAFALYSDDKTSADIWTSKNQKKIDTIKHQYSSDIIKNFIKNKKKEKILDVGCGAGFFLQIMKKNGWKKCVGVDINERYNSEYKDINGVQFINSTFESMSTKILGKNYGCISLQEALEHLYDIKQIKKKIYSLLRKGAILYIMIPNGFSLITRIARSMSPTFMWKHLNHFSVESLKSFLEKDGMFKAVHLETAVTEIDNIKSYLVGEYPYHGYGDPENLFKFITPEFIHQNNLGSRIIGIFKKK